MTPLRVAHLARWLEIGGTEQVILDLCRLGSGKQWVVAANDGPMRPVLERHGIPVRLGANPEQLARHLAEADVVNVHWLEYMPLLGDAARACGRPLVFTLHGLAVLPPVPGLVICTARRVHDSQQHNLDRRILILNGVDTKVFQPPAERGTGPVRVIRVCRPIRCAEYFWSAVFRMLEACPEAEVKVVGGPRYTCGRIEGLGNRHDVSEQLAQAHVFAYAPWPHEGTRDLVVMEAMASGLACVLSDVPCVHETVRHGETALLAPFGDENRFAEHLVAVVRDRELRESLGRRALQAAHDRLDMRSRVTLYESAYRRAITEAGFPQPE